MDIDTEDIDTEDETAQMAEAISRTVLRLKECIHYIMEQISHMVQSTAATSEESSASSEELAAHSNVLNELVGNFIFNKE